MALGKREDEQQEMWVATTSLPKSEGHVFYRKLNRGAGRGRVRPHGREECVEPHYHTHLWPPVDPAGRLFSHAAGRLL